MKTTTIWKSGHAFDSYQNEARIELHSGPGFGPKALLLTGLAGCSGIDVVDILAKMKVPFASLEIDAEAEQTDDPPRVFTTIHVHYRMRASEEDRPRIVRAIELSLDKYCGVAAMLKKNSKIEYMLTLQPEEA